MTSYDLLPDGNRRVPLYGSHYAEVKFGDNLRRADERAVLKAIDESGIDLSKPGAQMVGVLQDSVIARLVRRWTLLGDDGEPLPVTVEAVENLQRSTHRALAGAVAEFAGEMLTLLTEGPVAMDPKSAPSSPPPGAAGS